MEASTYCSAIKELSLSPTPAIFHILYIPLSSSLLWGLLIYTSQGFINFTSTSLQCLVSLPFLLFAFRLLLLFSLLGVHISSPDFFSHPAAAQGHSFRSGSGFSLPLPHMCSQWKTAHRQLIGCLRTPSMKCCCCCQPHYGMHTAVWTLKELLTWVFHPDNESPSLLTAELILKKQFLKHWFYFFLFPE